MKNANVSQTIRGLLVCGCVLSSGLFAADAIAQGRGAGGERRTVAAERGRSAGPAMQRSEGPSQSGIFAYGGESGDTPRMTGREGRAARTESSYSGRQGMVPRSMWSRASQSDLRATSPKELPWRESIRTPSSSERTRATPRMMNDSTSREQLTARDASQLNRTSPQPGVARNQPQTIQRDSNSTTRTPISRTPRETPTIRGGDQEARTPANIDRPTFRNREDTTRSIARPSNIRDDLRTRGLQNGIPRSDDRPIARANNDAPRSISRPAPDSIRQPGQSSGVTGRTNPSLSRNEPIGRTQLDSLRAPVMRNREAPISRTRDGIARIEDRTPTETGRTVARTTARPAPDIASSPRGVSREGLAGGTVTRRADSPRATSAIRRDGTVRTTSFRDSRTVARGSVNGRDVYIRTAHGHYDAHGPGHGPGHHRDLVVMNAGHWRPHRWPHGDYRPYYGPWRHGGWYHGPWHHGGWYHGHHDWGFSLSFTYVHSYYAPAGVVFYDVVPVTPVVYAPPVYSLNFAYVGYHRGVVVNSIRYVEPMYFAPPTMVVYPTVYAAPVVSSVVFTPIAPAPVVAPVAVPVVTPAYAPLYYYYPAYAYYPVYTAIAAPAYVVEPAPVVAPAVVETPSSGWSIGTAFSYFGKHGKGFSIGGTFTKVKSTPTVVTAAPAVVSGAAVSAAPAEAASAGEATLEAGLAAIRSNDMEAARDILSQVIVADPNNGIARMLYTAALMADGQYREAAESLRLSLETWPDFQLKDFYLPAVYDNPKVFTQTVRDAREFLSDHPERTDAWLLVAWSYAVSGQSDEATMLLTEAQRAWPDDTTFLSLDKAVKENDAAEQASASAQ